MAEFILFSQRLKRLMHKHALSPSQLASATGCSRTEVKNLLATDASEKKRKLFFENIQEAGLFSGDECRELHESLEISKTGIERYRFQIAIHHIISGKPLAAPPYLLQNGEPLSPRLSVFQDADQIDILCLNCCYPGIFQTLQPLFENPEREIRMWHLINVESHEGRAASIVAYSSPLLFDNRYYLYGVQIQNNEEIPSVGGNMLCIRGFVNGKKIEFFCNVISTHEAYELPNAAESDMFHHIANLFRTIRPAPIPLKEIPLQKQNFPSLCMSFLSRELNRSTYSLTNGICLQQIPVEIAIAAIRDCTSFDEKEAEELISEAYSIHERRFQNLYQKKKPTYLIMTKQGCESFLKTGLTLDHFVGFRAFTIEERQSIFKHFLENARSNSYFTPLLLKERELEYTFNMECYDKLGVLLDAKDNNYDPEGGYRSVFLTYPDFTRQYLSYYLETLVSDQCHTRAESLEILENIFKKFLSQKH